ncbi:L-ascorbate oxidase [Puccinia striiformis f. sp. tritici PST-78]|uniref:laccase n=1 Tax=Puccinia striiformis f. sp. tritici PST-78 TaxID=1165861 RepID=A0A0L0W4J2_9BASI|nr:L-ascorbate oxidase [Puccinia striiformis f. sp. tritici PST-78]
MVSIPNYSSSSAILFFLQLFLLLQSSYSQKNSNLNPGPYPDFSTTQYSKKVVLELSEKVISADCTNRPSVVINGTFPGPELRFKVGDQVEIRVHNLLKFNTTLHWHGLSQYGSPFADGTEKISQYAIPPGGYFDYIFQLEANSAGTYIYHAHVGFHLMTCHGAFIVEDLKSPPFKYDKELVMLFADYYHNLEQQITAGLDEVPFKWLGEPQSMVVNGNALGTCNSTSPFGCSTTCHHHRLVVKPDTTYRVRVIGITVLTYLYFGIEDHPALSVIEADGGYVRPASTEHIQLHSGQRYSFLLKTKSREELKKLGSKRDFWGRLETRWRPIRDQGAFVLHYEDDSPPQPYGSRQPDLSRSPMPALEQFRKLVPLPDEGNTWLTEKFEALDPNEVAPTASEVTRRITITGQQRKAPDGHINWFINGEKYVETQPQIPFLVRAYTTKLKPDYEAAAKNNGFDKKLRAYPVKLNDVVEFVVLNQVSTAGVTETHPWHLHGEAFFVVAHGTGEFTEAKKVAAEARFHKTHIRRDTEIIFSSKRGASYSNTTLPPDTVTGWMVLRMRAETPGAFLMHCHTQPHAAMGMAAVILVGIENLPPLPPGYINKFVTPPPS